MITRKEALKRIVAGSALPVLGINMASASTDDFKTSPGKINHSVCKWPYPNQTLEEICEAAQEFGIQSVELLDPDQWPIVERYGLTCAMANGSELHIPKGFNDPQYHEKLLKDYQNLIPKAAEAGLKNIICFSGNRNGLSNEAGLENCAKGLSPVVELAQKHGITVCMELLNSKVDHADYQCDHTLWGVDLCKKIGNEHFKLLYDCLLYTSDAADE